MSMAYIREAYGVPARRGQRVRYSGGSAPKVGAITSASGQYLYIRFDGESKRTGPFHPTWKLEYLEDQPEASATLIVIEAEGESVGAALEGLATMLDD